MALANITNNILTDSGILVGSLLTTSSAASTYVPYTGATADLVLGNRLSKANSFYADGDGSFTSGGLFLKQYASGATNITGYNIITTQTSGFLFSASVASSFKNFILDVSSLTDVTQRTYTLPDASGTLALTSSLSGMVTGTGTNNYIPKFTTTGSTIGNSIISESGSVITVAGTIVASNRITINGNNDLAFYGASSSTGYMHLQLSNTGNTTRLAQEGSTGGNMAVGSSAYATILNSTGAYSLQLATNNTVRATLDASGNLGLGVTPSAWSGVTTLQIGNSSLGDASTNLQLTHNAYYDGGNWRYITSAAASNYYQAGGFHFWRTAPSGTAGNAISFTQAMTLDASGRLGIGTTAPDVKLDVVGTHRIQLRTDDTIAEIRCITPNGAAFEELGLNGLDLRFYTSSTERMRITSGGNVGIGTTAPSYKLQVNGSDAGLYVIGASVAPFTQTIASFVYGGNGNSINIENHGGKASIQARVSSAVMELHLNPAGGNVGIGTTSPSQKLEVNGISLLENIQIGTTSAFLSNNVNAMIGWASSFSGYSNGTLILQSRSSAATPIVFATGSTSASERMIITSGGNVEINTGSIKTGEPDTGWGRAAIKIGARQSGEAFSSGGYLPVNVDGTVYYINLYSSTP
jgi:hypothetical protein